MLNLQVGGIVGHSLLDARPGRKGHIEFKSSF